MSVDHAGRRQMAGAVVVTGASAGIGKAIADLLAAGGYDVINLDRAPGPDVAIKTFEVDLADQKALQSVLIEVAEHFDVVALVNNAGFARKSALEDTDEALLRRTLDLNIGCAVQCARLLMPAMKARGYGRIVNISSRAALGRQLRTAYATSKGGLIAMTRVWALELAPFGITTNCVAPGPIATTLFERMNPPESAERAKMVADIPVGRIGEPRDVAHAVRFFLSPDSGFINGQTLYVCGGLSVGVAAL